MVRQITVCILLFSFGMMSCVQAEKESSSENIVCFVSSKDINSSKECFSVELAKTRAEQTIGLQHRKHLDQKAGMLFIFPQSSIRDFWMLNTLIPLDMIWINEKKEIVGITKDVQPCTTSECPMYSSKIDIKYVLEVNAGMSDKVGLLKGDIAQFNF